jgi:hypothetical protein
MRSKLLILLSLFFPHTANALKKNCIKQSFPLVAEEVGIWILLIGFVIGIFWLVGILFNSGLI